MPRYGGEFVSPSDVLESPVTGNVRPSGVITLREILELPMARIGDPQMVVEGTGLDTPVRWVHHGDIFDVAPLLRGGELLLTTGLALGTASSVDRVRYLDQLADAEVAALALELGRTFRVVPPEMKEAAGRRRLTLVAFKSAVPFMPIMEEVHTRLVDLRAAEMRLADDVGRLLNDALLEEIGLQGLLEAAAEIVHAPLVVATRVGRIAAIAGMGPVDDPVSLVRAAAMQTDIAIHGDRWGTVYLGQVPAGLEATAGLLLERLPTAVVLELLRSREVVTAQERMRRDLMHDLLNGRAAGGAGLHARAELAGFHPPLDAQLAGLALPVFPGLIDAIVGALGQRRIPAMPAVLDGDLLLLLALPAGANPEGMAQDLLAAVLTTGQAAAWEQGPIATGPPVKALSEAGRTLREARKTLALARRLRMSEPIIPASTLTLERLLSTWHDEPELHAIVDELLGPLLAYDAERSRELARTLEVFLLCGGSKVEAAKLLFLRRQSLYRRLETIEELAGPLDDATHRAALLVALKARRLLVPD